MNTLVIKAYNIQRNGVASEMRFTRSTISDDRLIVLIDEKNRKLWVFNGEKINNETKRLSKEAIEELNTMNNFEIVEISKFQWNERKDYLFKLSKDPSLEKIDLISRDVKSSLIKPSQTDTIEIKQAPSSDNQIIPDTSSAKPSFGINEPDTSSDIPSFGINEPDTPPVEKKMAPKKFGLAPSPPSRKNLGKSISSMPVTPAIQPKPAMKIDDSIIPQPPETEKTPSELDEKFIPIGDRGTGQIIDEFQITYYDKSGGSNFLLIEELDKGITKTHEYTQIKNLIAAINDLVANNATQLTASKILKNQLAILIKTIYRN